MEWTNLLYLQEDQKLQLLIIFDLVAGYHDIFDLATVNHTLASVSMFLFNTAL